MITEGYFLSVLHKNICGGYSLEGSKSTTCFPNPKFSSLAHLGGGFFESFFQVILAVVQHFRFDKVKKKGGNPIPIGSSLSAFLMRWNTLGRRMVSSFQLSSIKWTAYLKIGLVCFHFSENRHLRGLQRQHMRSTHVWVALEWGTQNRSCTAACAAKPKLSMNEHVVLLLKGRLPVWQFLSHVSTSVKLLLSSIFGVFISWKLGKFTYFPIGKGPITGPEFGTGKSLPSSFSDT